MERIRRARVSGEAPDADAILAEAAAQDEAAAPVNPRLLARMKAAADVRWWDYLPRNDDDDAGAGAVVAGMMAEMTLDISPPDDIPGAPGRASKRAAFRAKHGIKEQTREEKWGAQGGAGV